MVKVPRLQGLNKSFCKAFSNSLNKVLLQKLSWAAGEPPTYAGSVWTSPPPPITTHSTFHGFTKGNDGEREREKKRQIPKHQPVVLRSVETWEFDAPRGQNQRNLPLMKYDMCANGAPPPIQRPVIIHFRINVLNDFSGRKRRGGEGGGVAASLRSWSRSGRWGGDRAMDARRPFKGGDLHAIGRSQLYVCDFFYFILIDVLFF